MICDLIFKLENEEIPLTIETESSSYPTDDEILDALKNPINALNKDKLYSYIADNYEPENAKVLDLDELFYDEEGNFRTPNGLVGNTNTTALSQLYPDAKFPEGVTAHVLAVKKLVIGGRTISGRCITSNGEELFIINNTSDVKKLAQFLTFRKLLEDNPNLFDEQSDSYKDLQILVTKFEKASIQELLLDFNEDSTPFRTLYFINSEGKTDFAYNYLDKISRIVQDGKQLVQYTDPFINAISKLHKLRNENSKKKDEKRYAITYDELFYAVQAYYPDLLKSLKATTIRKFKNRMRESDFDRNLFEEVIENKPLIYTLLTNLIKKDTRYQYEITSATLDEVQLKYKWATLESLYGFDHSTVRTVDLVNPDHRGYKIYAFLYNGETVYTYSRNYLTNTTTIYKTFSSEQEVKDYLNENILTLKLKTNSFLKFKLRASIDGVTDPSKYIYKIDNSALVFDVKSIVESLDVLIDPLTQLKSDEKRLIDFREATLQDFYNLVNTWEVDDNVKAYIQNKINNPEKAVTYIYKINEALKEDRTNAEALQLIADDISSAPKVAYYINSRSGNDYTLIPTEPNIVEKWKIDKQTPVILILSAVQAVLQLKVGVDINLLTSSQIAEKFPVSSVDPNTAKAFIFDGQIYVNTTIASGEDLLHEYVHIFLGVLKSNPESRAHYEELVNFVWNKAKKEELLQALKDYKDKSNMDIREELFARKFSEYLLRNRTSDMTDIFLQLENYMQEGMKTIFDLMGDEPLSSTYSRSISTTFRRFSSDIASLLELGSGLDLELIKDTRKKTAYLNKLIKDGKITEIC